MPEHVVFSADLPASPEPAKPPAASVAADGDGNEALALTHAIHRHVRYVYERCRQNQRRTAKLLGISRSRLDRYLVALKNGTG
jgi:transcriptional regulator with PAS, ATPase and Fis domain